MTLFDFHIFGVLTTIHGDSFAGPFVVKNQGERVYSDGCVGFA